MLIEVNGKNGSRKNRKVYKFRKILDNNDKQNWRYIYIKHRQK